MNAESNFQTFQKSIPWHQTTPIDPTAEAVDRDLLTGPNLPIISATHHDKSATAGKWIQFSLLQPYTASLHHTTFTESRLILLSINGSLVNYEAANIPLRSKHTSVTANPLMGIGYQSYYSHTSALPQLPTSHLHNLLGVWVIALSPWW